MKRTLFIVVIVISSLLFLHSTVFAQESPEEKARRLGITFPIAQLGNCESISVCKAYCDDPSHFDTCTSFAKAKGFYQEVSLEERLSDEEKTALAVAKTELGCDSPSSCHSFCEQEQNFQKCADFAKQQGFADEAAAFEIMKPAMKQFLGCDSMESCMAFCMNPLNMGKCMEFAKQMGFDTGEGGYSSESSEEWCRNSSSECAWEAASNTCVCNGQQTCSQIPDCSWNGSYCSCGGESGVSSNEPGDVWCPKVAREGEACSWDGSTCTCWNPGECTKWPGCTWTGKTCECTTTSSSSPSYFEEVAGEGCNKQPGCQWTGTTCECAAQAPEPGDVWCPKASQGGQVCTWDGASCTCQGPTEYITPQYQSPLEYQSPELKGETIPSSQEQSSPSASAVQGARIGTDVLQILWSTIDAYIRGGSSGRGWR